MFKKKIFKSNSNTIIWWLWLWIPWPTWSDPNHFSTFTQNETMNFLKELFVILKYKINCISSCNQNMLHKQKKSISTKSYISFTIFELSTTTHDYMRWSPNWDPIQHWRNRHRSHLHQIASVPQRYQIITKPSTFCAKNAMLYKTNLLFHFLHTRNIFLSSPSSYQLSENWSLCYVYCFHFFVSFFSLFYRMTLFRKIQNHKTRHT